ncbi:MAG: hypothetical protein HY909_02285 [Deltaproteobacteria bacterium]|nr:hypothetical protein [Deltaproteobacteria bacterium]
MATTPWRALAAPADYLRRAVLVRARPMLRGWFTDRERRVAVGGAVGVGMAFALAVGCPLWAVAFGPAVLGIPHALSDLRYLVARPGLHRRPRVLLPIVVGSALGWRYGVSAALAGAALAALLARGAVLRKVLVALVPAGLAALAWNDRHLADLAFVHLHNAVAVGLWLSWRRRAGWWHLVPLGALGLGLGLVLHGDAERASTALGAWSVPAPGFEPESLAWTLSPEDTWGLRAIQLYAFGQAVHYALWLRVVPAEDRPRETPRSYAQSLEALLADLPLWVLGPSVLAMCGLFLWALQDPFEARWNYLRLAFWHGYLELGAAAVFAVEGFPRRPRGPV